MIYRAVGLLFVALASFTISSGTTRLTAADAKSGKPVEYRERAFYPKRWDERKISTKLTPWEGKKVVLLTTSADFDAKTMGRFLDRLDGGWQVYADLVGGTPRPFKQLNGKPTVAAIPDAALSCGIGCGYIGATGIEVGGFYAGDYDLVRKKPDAFPHYYFYEMGRNYYVFGDRHSLFITGYAVFMRYVCMDSLKCEDPEAKLRQVIEQAEEIYSKSGVSFLTAFTTLGDLDEKAPRLKGADGRTIHPSDQPVLYASAMLKLRKAHGGDAWVKKFFHTLAKCPAVKPSSKDAALAQSLNWVVAASTAAGKDLTPVFVDRWKFPLDKSTVQALKAVNWADKNLNPAEVLKGLKPAFTSAVPDKDGWEVLFDGKNLDAFNMKKLEGIWAINAAGELYPAKPGETIYTKKRYCDFVFEFECKMEGGKKTNSGAFVRVHDPRPNEEVWTGLEIQILDNADYKFPFNSLAANASLYGLVGPKVDANKPVGEWNKYRITADGPMLTIELNGKEVVKSDLSKWTKPGENPDGKKNKFPHAIGSLPREGFVGLQNYNATPVAFRNVRIKPLSDRKPKYTGSEAIDKILDPPPAK